MRYGGDLLEVPPVIAVALLDCSVRRGNSGHEEKDCDLDLLGADFFDDESMVVLYRCRKGDGALILFCNARSDRDRATQNKRLSHHSVTMI
jgi:hypothetical protein